VDAKEQTENTTKLRQRMLKSPKAPKSPKSAKPIIVKDFCPVETVAAEVYTVQGSTTVISAGATNGVYQGISKDCTLITRDGGFVWDSLFQNADTQGQLNDSRACSIQEFLTPNDNWDPPIYFINDGNEATYQIVDAGNEGVVASPGSINDSMFKGEVACGGGDCAANKVIIKFQDFTLTDLWEVRINQIEFIEFDYYPISCPGGALACPNQFYIGIYTHEAGNGYPLDNTNWYNCRYNFSGAPYLTVGTGATGEWSTLRVDGKLDTASGVSNKGATTCSATTLENAPDEHLLGSNYLEPTIFILNMGQSDISDNGLAGYFDNIRIKIIGQDLRVYDL
jgi:hypothetical protein